MMTEKELIEELVDMAKDQPEDFFALKGYIAGKAGATWYMDKTLALARLGMSVVEAEIEKRRREEGGSK
jgi:hypothetical protein